MRVDLGINSEDLMAVKRRWTIADRSYGWSLSPELFGDVGPFIADFNADNYVYFLDNSRSLLDLMDGLIELSPFADDALTIAEGMTERDFADFKLALAYERGQNAAGNLLESTIPYRFVPLVIPFRFIEAFGPAEKFEVELGVMLFRLMELEEAEKGK